MKRGITFPLILGHEGNPFPTLLLVLSLCVGVPMFVICTTAPLLQRWFSSTDHPSARDPYFLYGASNLGSMLALLGYPGVVEPYFTLRSQRIDWAFGFAILAGLTGLCIWLALRSRPAVQLAGAGTEGQGAQEAEREPEPVASLASGTATLAPEREAIKPAGGRSRFGGRPT